MASTGAPESTIKAAMETTEFALNRHENNAGADPRTEQYFEPHSQLMGDNNNASPNQHRLNECPNFPSSLPRLAAAIPPMAMAAAAAAAESPSIRVTKRKRPRAVETAKSASSGPHAQCEPTPAPLVKRQFQWPVSLLEDRPISHKRTKIIQDVASLPLESTPHKTQVCGLRIPLKRLGVCGKCSQTNHSVGDNSDVGDTILLCDGPGCGQEYHMKCCTPPLHVVPKGLFYCFDCSEKGSTLLLEEYFLQHERAKEDHEAKQELTKNKPMMISFADFLLRGDVIEEFSEKESTVVSDDTTKSSTKSRSSRQRENTDQQDDFLELPCSELERLYDQANNLIGKPVRLYCPLGNNYHNGRIIDIRPCTGDTLCLIRFPAGKDNRKKALTIWVFLEEHCLAVATEMLWGLFGNKSAGGERTTKKRSAAVTKKPPQWTRAKVWSRTARELVPVMHLLDRRQDQIRFRQVGDQIGGTEETKDRWGLVETVGTGMYELLNLPMETRSDDAFIGKETSNGYMQDPVVDGMVQVEMREQTQIRRWRSAPLENPFHTCALRVQDEYALGSVDVQMPHCRQLLRTSALVPQGLDRSMLLDLVSLHLGKTASRDLAVGIACEMSEPI